MRYSAKDLRVMLKKDQEDKLRAAITHIALKFIPEGCCVQEDIAKECSTTICALLYARMHFFGKSKLITALLDYFIDKGDDINELNALGHSALYLSYCNNGPANIPCIGNK